MKSATKITLFLTFLVGLFLLAGCQERPRPSPDQTMIGEGDYQPGYFGDAAARTGTTTQEADQVGDWDPVDDWGSEFPIEPLTGLEERGTFGDGEQVRGMFDSVYFEFDRSNILSGERAKIEAVADHLRNNPNQNILLEGHCDWRGTTEYNLGLGDRRATSVMEYLQNLGISRNRIEVLSMGDLEATAGGTEAQMAEDRRVEFVILQ